MKTVSQYLKVYSACFNCVTFREIYMATIRTRIDVRTTTLKCDWDIVEITKAQFDRIETLAYARMDQYYMPDRKIEEMKNGIFDAMDIICKDFNDKILKSCT